MYNRLGGGDDCTFQSVSNCTILLWRDVISLTARVSSILCSAMMTAEVSRLTRMAMMPITTMISMSVKPPRRWRVAGCSRMGNILRLASLPRERGEFQSRYALLRPSSSLIRGRKRAVTITPTMKPSTTVIRGSSIFSRPSTSTFTSSS